MYKEYLINIEQNSKKVIDNRVNNFYIFNKNKMSYVRDLLFLENKYKMLINNKLKM